MGFFAFLFSWGLGEMGDCVIKDVELVVAAKATVKEKELLKQEKREARLIKQVEGANRKAL